MDRALNVMVCGTCGKVIELGVNSQEDFLLHQAANDDWDQDEFICDDCYEKIMEVDEDELES